MKMKEKTCKVCQEKRFLFSKGRCKSCAQKAYYQKTQENKKKKLNLKKSVEFLKDQSESGRVFREVNEIAREEIQKAWLIPKPKKKKKALKPTKKYKEQKDAERSAMQELWNEKADELGFCYCEECLLLNVGSGQAHAIANLGSEFNPFNVAHIISKGSNKKFQADKRNFILLCANHHTEFDAQFEGKTREDMKIFAQTEAIRIKLKREDSENNF